MPAPATTSDDRQDIEEVPPYERAKNQLPMLIQQLGGTDDTLKLAEDLIKAAQDFQTHIGKRGRVQLFVERLQPSDNSDEFCPNPVVRALYSSTVVFNRHTRKFGRMLSEALRSFASHKIALANALDVSARRPSVPCEVGRKAPSVQNSGSSYVCAARPASEALGDDGGVTLKRLKKRTSTSDGLKTRQVSPPRTPDRGETNRGEGCLPLDHVGRPVQISFWFPNRVSQQSRIGTSLTISGGALALFDSLSSAKAVRHTYKKFFNSLFSWLRENAAAFQKDVDRDSIDDMTCFTFDMFTPPWLCGTMKSGSESLTLENRSSATTPRFER